MKQRLNRASRVVCLVFLLGVPLKAQAQGDFDDALAAAVKLFENLDYEQALEQLQRARRLAWSDDQDVTVDLHEGIFLAEMNQPRESRAAFKKGLLRRPEAKLPLKVSPKLEREFESVREEVLAERSAAPPVVEKDRPEQGPGLSWVPPEKPAAAPWTPGVEEQVHSGVPVVPVVLAGASVVSAGVGALFGVRANTASREMNEAYAGGRLPEQSWLAEVDQRRKDAYGQARMANLLFVTAAVAMGGAVVTWLMRPDDAGTKPLGEP